MHAVVSVGEIRSGVIAIEPRTPRVGKEVVERLPQYILDPRDVVVSRKGTVDRSSWVDPRFGRLFLGSDAIAVRFENELSARAYGYVLQARASREWLIRHASGSTMLSMNSEILGRLPVPILSNREMKAIVEVLGALDDKIAANQRLVTLILELGESMVQACDLAPTALAELATITMGTSPRGEYLNDDGIGIPFFQGVRDFGAVYPAKRIFTLHPARTAPDGAVLFAVRAPVGKTNLAVGDTAIGRGLASIASDSQPATLFFSMRAFETVWDEFQGGGTVFASINGSDVRSTMLPMPSGSETLRLEAKLSALLGRATIAERESETLANTRDELLPLLMSGKITVKDAEKQVEQEV